MKLTVDVHRQVPSRIPNLDIIFWGGSLDDTALPFSEFVPTVIFHYGKYLLMRYIVFSTAYREVTSFDEL